MSQARYTVKKVGPLTDKLQKGLKISGISFKGMKLPLTLSGMVQSPKRGVLKRRRFGKADMAKREVKAADSACLNQSFLYQSLEEKQMSREKLPDHIVMWKTHSPKAIAKRLEQTNRSLAKTSPISKRTVEDMKKSGKAEERRRKMHDDEWALLKKPNTERHFKISAITPYK